MIAHIQWDISEGNPQIQVNTLWESGEAKTGENKKLRWTRVQMVLKMQMKEYA